MSESNSTVKPRNDEPLKWRDQLSKDANDFIELLQTRDKGDLAMLRRNAGEVLPGRGVAWFPSLLRSGNGRRHEEIFFLVATLYDYNPDSDTKQKKGKDFGQSLAFVAEKMKPSETPENARKQFRRFHLLLDASFDVIVDPQNPDAVVQSGGGEMMFRLRQLVKLCASKEVGIDWPQLLVDLCQWSNPNKTIQKKWSRSFFGQRSEATPQTEVIEEAAPI